jgi:preprotein translocase subunit SecE
MLGVRVPPALERSNETVQGAQRFVVFAYLAIGLLVWATLAKLLGALAYAANVPNPGLLGNNFTLAHLLGLVGAIGIGMYLWKNQRAKDFGFEVVAELRKVTWPSRKETQTATVVVIVTTIICAVILAIFDTLWAQITGIIYTSAAS